ncbi:MAG TPA: SRPBCC family protein [Candidatus Limnocylindria bacterium]
MTSAQPQAQPVTLTMPSDRELRIERVFNAPRDRVFAAYTDPALIPQWWGAETVVEEMDVRTGGSWRFVAHYPNGYEAAFSGTYREVTPPEKIAQTFSVEGMGTTHVETITFGDLGERTRLTVTSLFDTTEQRDSIVASGAERGANETYARLEALLASLAA